MSDICCICFDKMNGHHRCVQCGMKICINCVYVLRKYEGKKTTFVGLNMACCSPSVQMIECMMTMNTILDTLFCATF